MLYQSESFRRVAVDRQQYFIPTIFFILFCFLPLLSEAQWGIQKFDDKILIDISTTRTKPQTNVALFISKTNDYVNIAIPIGLLAGGLIGNDKQMLQNSLYVGSSTAVSFLLMELVKVCVKRPRPFIANININPISRPTSYSFPSGHTSSSFTTATALSMAYPKWYVVAPAFLWAGSVSYSRMYLGVHNATDVGTGAIIGVGTSLSLSAMRYK